MPSVLDELVALLSLEKLEENLYRGQSQDLGWGVVFGGQVLGQALTAAMRTVDGRPVHSLHAYFLRPGDVKAPIVYDVDRIRDGSSFTTRRVVAIQHGEPIFNLAASFQKIEPGFSHHDEAPKVPAPESLPTDQERLAVHGADKLPEAIRAWVLADRPIEWRTVEDDDPFHPKPTPGDRSVWFKAKHQLPDDPSLHQALLAYASDSAFLTTAMKPHGVTWWTRGMQVASLDHAVWFHRPFRVDEWLLHVMHSPSAAAARGLVFGRVFNRDGVLVASTAQEGLTRQR